MTMIIIIRAKTRDKQITRLSPLAVALNVWKTEPKCITCPPRTELKTFLEKGSKCCLRWVGVKVWSLSVNISLERWSETKFFNCVRDVEGTTAC